MTFLPNVLDIAPDILRTPSKAAAMVNMVSDLSIISNILTALSGWIIKYAEKHKNTTSATPAHIIPTKPVADILPPFVIMLDISARSDPPSLFFLFDIEHN